MSVVSADAAPMPTPMADLLEHMDIPQCQCLNAASDHMLKDSLLADSRDDPEKFLQSDCDEELLITITFQQACRVSAIKLESSADPDGASSTCV